jgi:hypothetical protein
VGPEHRYRKPAAAVRSTPARGRAVRALRLPGVRSPDGAGAPRGVRHRAVPGVGAVRRGGKGSRQLTPRPGAGASLAAGRSRAGAGAISRRCAPAGCLGDQPWTSRTTASLGEVTMTWPRSEVPGSPASVSLNLRHCHCARPPLIRARGRAAARRGACRRRCRGATPPSWSSARRTSGPAGCRLARGRFA